MIETKVCECCGQVIIDYKVTITRRNVLWLMSLSYLSKTKFIDQDGFVHYSDVHKFVKSKFDGIVVSSYGTMGSYPWNLIEQCKPNPKFKSNGLWKLTPIGQDFIYGKIKIVEASYFNHDGCYNYIGEVGLNDLKSCNFKELVEIFNSF